MEPDRYYDTIEQLLRQIPELERNLSSAQEEKQRINLERTLKLRRKRFEHLIPYQFRRQLLNICRDVGVRGDFM